MLYFLCFGKFGSIASQCRVENQVSCDSGGPPEWQHLRWRRDKSTSGEKYDTLPFDMLWTSDFGGTKFPAQRSGKPAEVLQEILDSFDIPAGPPKTRVWAWWKSFGSFFDSPHSRDECHEMLKTMHNTVGFLQSSSQ